VAETVAYYAIVDECSTRERPAGVLRRIVVGGEQRDEAFGRNLAWGHATGRYPGNPPASDGGPLSEITEDEARQIVARMLRAAAQQVLPAAALTRTPPRPGYRPRRPGRRGKGGQGRAQTPAARSQAVRHPARPGTSTTPCPARGH
jgi:hypothetical protein